MRIKRVTSDVGDKIASMALWMLGLGVILAIWGGVWGVFLYNNPPKGDAMYFVAGGIFLTGLDLAIIGLLSGRIGRAVREKHEHREEEADQIAVTTPEGERRD